MATDNHRKRSSKKNPPAAPAKTVRTARPPRRTKKAVPDAVGATSGIPVIGLGGSAGALEVFNAFFEAMPADSGAAFVVIQHLAPAHVSLLTELLAQHTTMKVVEAAEDTPVEPNCVYVIPPSKYLGIRDGVLALSEPVMQGGIRMPIDFFFRALAEDRQERAVCVLLSGAGSDGALGVRAIRGAGGLTIAQDPQTAQYGDMPRSAIATKMVDYVLPAEKMPQTIMEYLRQPYVRGGEPADVLAAEDQAGGYNEILSIVQAQTTCDFRCYKKSTILRRIERRMGLHRLTDMAVYSTRLRTDTSEVGQLLKDLLINVTAFFRDTEAFEELRRQALAPLISTKSADEPLRVWVAGCSTGEEAYSLVMLLLEEMTAARKICPLQVFATDIDEEALATARVGLYPESIAADVSPERLARFFIRKEHGFQVSEAVRNAVVFASQNLITDPPFSKMDLISCRNLLIYLDTETQMRLIPLFNFALNPGGYLFLGKSEGVGGQSDLFGPISKQARIFRRNSPARAVALDTPILPGKRRTIPSLGLPAGKPAGAVHADLLRLALLSHFAASVVLVDQKGQILQFHGPMGKYLETPASEPRLNLLESAKEGLALRLRSALHTALNEGRIVVLEEVPVTRSRHSPVVRITVQPMLRRGSAKATAQSEPVEPLLAVIFEDMPRPAAVGPEPPPSAGSDKAVQQLEDELRATQQDLQASIEELQAANEEMRVSNEEVVSTNEELQSTNEELETSKEELQSVNEELTTVNSQLQEKVESLDETNNDLANLLKSTQIATLFLDSKLRIKFFTPATTRLLKLIPSDTGRPIGDLSVNFVDFDLEADARSVAKGGAMIERDVRHSDGSYYVVRVAPYQTPHGQTDGVVATFTDVTRLRRGELLYSELVQNANSAIVRWKCDGSITFFNNYAETFFGYNAGEVLGKSVGLLVPTRDSAGTDLSNMIQKITDNPDKFANNVNENICRDGRRVWMAWTNKPIFDEQGQVAEILAVGIDITDRKRAEEALREREGQLNIFVEHAPAALAMFDTQMRYLAASKRWLADFGLAGQDLRGKSHYEVFPEISKQWREIHSRCLAGAVEHADEDRFERADGSMQWLRWECRPWQLASGEVGGVVIFSEDITKKREAEEAMRQSEQRFRTMADSISQLAWIAKADGYITWYNRRWHEYTGTTPEEMEGWGWQSVHDPALLPSVLERWKASIATGQIFEMEFPLRGADGQYRPFLTRGIPVKNAQGRVLEWFGTNTEITDLKRTEDALREAKERADWLARFPEENPNPILRASGDGLAMYCNPAAAKLPEWSCRIDEQVSPHLRPLVYEALTSETDSLHELLLGGRWFAISIVPVPEGGYVNVYGRDVTSRKEAEEALKESEAKLLATLQRFYLMFSGMYTGVLLMTEDGRVEFVNQAFCDAYDLKETPEELRGMASADLMEKTKVCHQNPEEAAARIEEIVRLGKPVKGVEFAMRNGKTVMREFVPLNIDGRPSGRLWLHIDITARKQAEQAVQRSESILRAITDNSPDPIFLKDRQCRLIFANPATLRAIGKPAEEIIGKSDDEFYDDPEIGRAIMANDRRIMESGRDETVEEVIQNSDGTKRIYLSTKALFRVQGQILGIVGVARDITERKQAEEAIRESEERYRSLFENMLSGYAYCQMIYENEKPTDFVYLGVNEAFERLTGLKDVVGKKVSEVIPGFAESENDLLQTYGRVAATGRPERFETYVEQLGIWFSLSVYSPSKEHFVAVFDNITERRQAEEALRQSEERYRRMFEGMLEGFCIIEVLFDVENWPTDARFLEINPAFEAQTGLHNVQSKRISELNLEIEPYWFEICGKVALTGEPVRVVNEVKALKRWFDVSASRVGGPESRKVAVLFNDITERQKALENLRQTAAELARSNKELEQFAYVASHDLQEPLRGVIGFVNLLKERYQGHLDARADEYIGFAVEGATRMNALILDLLSYSRVGFKGQAFLPTDLEAPLFRALANLKTSIEECGAEVTRDELPTVPADPGQITQLFQNLIGNALKFHSDKKPEIHVGAELKDGQWLISVRDNGIGLDMKHQDRIFQIFQRLHARDAYPGTGIGLAVCKKIVEGHGGRIWVESQPGQGTTFFFTLPERRA